MIYWWWLEWHTWMISSQFIHRELRWTMTMVGVWGIIQNYQVTLQFPNGNDCSKVCLLLFHWGNASSILSLKIYVLLSYINGSEWIQAPLLFQLFNSNFTSVNVKVKILPLWTEIHVHGEFHPQNISDINDILNILYIYIKFKAIYDQSRLLYFVLPILTNRRVGT